jgi:hypothetical protein
MKQGQKRTKARWVNSDESMALNYILCVHHQGAAGAVA